MVAGGDPTAGSGLIAGTVVDVAGSGGVPVEQLDAGMLVRGRSEERLVLSVARVGDGPLVVVRWDGGRRELVLGAGQFLLVDGLWREARLVGPGDRIVVQVPALPPRRRLGWWKGKARRAGRAGVIWDDAAVDEVRPVGRGQLWSVTVHGRKGFFADGVVVRG